MSSTDQNLPNDAPAPVVLPEPQADVRRRSLAIAWGAGIFLAIGVGLPIGYALRDWRAGVITGLIIGVLTMVGYLKAGADHAERRADRLADKYTREDQDDEDDDGSYN